MGNRVPKPSNGRLKEVLVTSQEGHGGNRGLSHHAVLYSLSERSRTFGSSLGHGFAAASFASGNGFFSTLPQPALERIPSSPNAHCAVTEDYRIGARGHDSFRSGAARINCGPFRARGPS